MIHGAAIVLMLFFLVPTLVWAQIKDEIPEKKIAQVEQESLEKEVIASKQEKKKYSLSSFINLGGSYETNPLLSSNGKGDQSTRLKYSTYLRKPLSSGLDLKFNYNIDGTIYSDYTDLTNILNHVRISIDQSMNPRITVGTGYDLSIFYYPKDEESNYYFHKGFIYFKHNLTKNMYHQIMWEEGLKSFIHSRPYLDSTSTFRDGHRLDLRHAWEYSIGRVFNNKFSARLRSKYSINDSNARYQDYHDYSSVDVTPSMTYQLTNKFSLDLSMMYSDKKYKERLTTDNSSTRKDQTYSPAINLRFYLTKSQTIQLGYEYADNLSNDPTAEYKSSAINGSWQYGF